MHKLLIWGLGNCYNIMKNTISYLEICSQIKVVAIVANDAYMLILDGYPVIKPSEIGEYKWDYIIVMSDIYYDSIVNDAINNYGIGRDKLIPYRVLQIPNISFQKYIKLKESSVSIISNNCWGGVAYHTLGLECLSPFKNLFLKDDDYLRVIKNLKQYMAEEPVLKRYKISSNHSRYPVLQIDDIEIYCNHTSDGEQAIKDWNRRKSKINFDNLYIEMYTTNPNIATRFIEETIGYKGICFVPWITNESKLLTLEMPSKHKEFWETVNANGSLNSYGLKYSLIDLLNGDVVLRY